MFRLIIWTIIIYFIFKFIGRIINAFLMQNTPRQNDSSSSSVHPSDGNGNSQNGNRSRYNIDKKDIVEAKFEEIKPEKEEAKPEEDKKTDKE